MIPYVSPETISLTDQTKFSQWPDALGVAEKCDFKETEVSD